MMTISIQSLAIVCSVLLLSSPVFAGEPVNPDAAIRPDISPYLNFHHDDLVQWQTWNKTTLQVARRSGKLILLSSGYYACYYCHVMKRESFEDPAIADFINRHFIPVLIDRELQPVLDAQLLRFMEAIGAPQGWPLNIVLTSNAYPLVGTVYRPANSFLSFLQQVQTNWSQNRAHWERIAQAASEQIVAEATVPAFVIETQQQQKRIHDAFEQQARLVADKEYGGFGNGAKYPMSPQLLALIRLYALQPTAWLETHLRKTLHNMASGGLHDPLGGGFFRYTTDRQWRTPHYEKMLYDNAQLALVYLEAARILDEAAFQHVATKTLEFLLQSMSASNGGFVASLSAVDAQDNDGGYYLWTEKELKSILQPQELQLVTHLWQVIETEGSQGRHRYLPTAYMPTESELAVLAKTFRLSQQQVRVALKSVKQKILAVRKKRRLLRDEKHLAGWNGLTLLTFARAARLSSDVRYQQTAAQLYQFIAGKLWRGEQLRRTPEGGISELTDYAYIAAGVMEYAQLTDDAAHYRLCASLVAQAWQRFYIDGFWRRTEDLELLLPYTVYPVTLPDSELPSPAATLISITLQLGDFLERRYTEYAHTAQRTVDGNLVKSPFFYGTQITGWQTTHANNEPP
jgi:uncharacterized protein YyaL (SSP411 family)